MKSYAAVPVVVACLLMTQVFCCANAQTDPRTSALASWYFGDGISGETSPLTSNGSVGYNVVPTGLGARPNRKAAQLNSAYFNAGTNLGVSGNQITVYLRACMPNGSWKSGLFAKRGSVSTLNYNLFCAVLSGTSGPSIGFELNTVKASVQLSFPVSLVSTTAWHNLVGRYDGTNVQLYCNDRLMASAPLTGNLLQNSEPTLIGAETDNGSIVRPFTGYIEEAAIWNAALTSDQLAYLNNLTATNDAYPTQLLHYRDPNHDIGDIHVRSVGGNWALTYLYNIGGIYYQAQLISCDFLHWTTSTPTHASVSGPDVLPNWFAIESIWDPNLAKWRSVWGYYGMRSSVSDNRFNWFAPTPQLLLSDPGTYSRFSDPAITQVASNSWQMVMTVLLNGLPTTGGLIGWASSSNLTQWTYKGSLYFPGNRGAPECPTLFSLGNKWYLLSSWSTGAVGCPTYEVADSPIGPWSEFTPNCLDGKDVCAATSDSDGSRRILFGWIPLNAWYSSGQHWGGHLCFPHEIFQVANGALRSRLPADFEGKIRGPQLFPALANPSAKSGNWNFQGSTINCFSGTGSGSNRAILPSLYDRFEADMTFTPYNGTSRVGWLLNWQESGSFFEVGLDVTNQLLFIRTAGGTIWDSLNVSVNANSQHRLRVIVEQDMVEVVFDEQFTLAGRIPTKLSTTSLGLFVDDGPVSFDSVNVYRLNNLQSIPPVPPTVSLRTSANKAVLTFTGILQFASQLSGPFSDMAGPVSPLTLLPTGGSRFWRTRSP